MNSKQIVLLVSLILVFILIYIAKVDRHCPAHPFVPQERSL